MALNGPRSRDEQCLLTGVKPTQGGHRATSASDPKRRLFTHLERQSFRCAPDNGIEANPRPRQIQGLTFRHHPFQTRLFDQAQVLRRSFGFGIIIGTQRHGSAARNRDRLRDDFGPGIRQPDIRIAGHSELLVR
jgi:hypothetical protein